MMDCPPPIKDVCVIEKQGVRLAEIPCTVAFKCGDKKTIGTLVMQDHDEAMKLLETKPNDKE